MTQRIKQKPTTPVAALMQFTATFTTDLIAETLNGRCSMPIPLWPQQNAWIQLVQHIALHAQLPVTVLAF